MTRHPRTAMSPGRTGLLMLLAASAAGARVLAPEWSRPLAAKPVSASVRRLGDGREELLLLMPDRQVLVVSAGDTLRRAGVAPAGSTALAGLPPNGERQEVLVFAGAYGLTGWDFLGNPLWRKPLEYGARAESIEYLGARDGTAHLCLWASSGLVRVAMHGESVRTSAVELSFVPSSTVRQDLNRDGVAEILAADGRHLAVLDFGNQRATTVEWPGSGIRALRSQPQAGAFPLVAAVAFGPESAVVAAVLTTPVEHSTPGHAGYDSLRSVRAATGVEQWAVGISVNGLPGPALGVVAAGRRPCVVGIQGTGYYVATFDEQGRRVALSNLSGKPGRPVGFLSAGGWPAVIWQSPPGHETFYILPPGGAGAEPETPGYSGVKLLAVTSLRLDSDTFPDVVVIRSSNDAGLRIDCLRNSLGAVAAQLALAQAAVTAAVQNDNEAELARAMRRVRLLSQVLSPGDVANTTESDLLQVRHLRRRGRMILYVGLALLGTALVLIPLLHLAGRRRRRMVAGRLIEEQPLAVRTSLAQDLVAIDHNFVSKGNWPAACERLIEARRRYGLDRDIDLGRMTAEVEPYYSNVISRLIDATPTIRVRDFIVACARRARGDARTVVEDLSREEYRRREDESGFRVVCVRSREYPDVYEGLRWFSNAKLTGILEHVVVDHLRYARGRATITLEYIVSTQWTRRLEVRFFSDSPDRIDFGRPEGHLTGELRELASVLRPVVEVSGLDRPPKGPEEKLWLRVGDLVSVLEETRARLRGAGD